MVDLARERSLDIIIASQYVFIKFNSVPSTMLASNSAFKALTI